MANKPIQDSAAGQPFASLWVRVGWGLQLKLYAVSVLAVLFIGIAGVTVVSPRIFASPTVLYAVATVFLFALLLDFVGRSLCLTPPSQQATRTLVAGSIGAQLLAIIMLFTPLLAVPELPVGMRIVSGMLLAGCAQAVAAVLFMSYAREVALAMHRPDLANAPFIVLSFNLSSLTMTTVLLVTFCFVLVCPCMWWLVGLVLAILAETTRGIGMTEPMFWSLVRLLPTLLVSLLLYFPLSRYGKLIQQLKAAVNDYNQQLQSDDVYSSVIADDSPR